jgi:hypothetical protein
MYRASSQVGGVLGSMSSTDGLPLAAAHASDRVIPPCILVLEAGRAVAHKGCGVRRMIDRGAGLCVGDGDSYDSLTFVVLFCESAVNLCVGGVACALC